MTVQSKYVTLSNGRLVSQKNNNDGTRTDTWKMDLPHSPYLFMMAVGDFKIYRDKWRNKEVNYYMEPKYASYAKQIFGLTPEMIEVLLENAWCRFSMEQVLADRGARLCKWRYGKHDGYLTWRVFEPHQTPVNG